MTTITAPTRPEAIALDGDQCVALRGLDWKGYSTLLRLRGERSAPRMIYLDGDLRLMSPSLAHEDMKKMLGHFITEVVVGLDILCRETGQTTFRRRKKEAGVEGDETYYVANAERVLGKKIIDLRTDPPPDLAIEAVYSHGVEASLEVYRRLGVPEVWVCDETGLQILLLQADGQYVGAPSSAAFPFLTAADVDSWLRRPNAGPNSRWVKEVRVWVRDVLAPRLAGKTS